MKTIRAGNLIAFYDERHKPCAEVELEETFIIETHDRIPAIAATETLADSFKDEFDPIYSVTGPVFINGTHAGHLLRVDIGDITLQDKGIICATPGRAGFGDKIDESHSKIVDMKGSQICFSEKIRVPANPHIGKLATTPSGDRVPTGSPGPHGGNMDNKHLTTGSSIFLRVFVEGALLSVGDLHAAMGDGESNSSGVEAAGQVTLRCHLAEGLDVRQPLVVTPSEVQMLGQGKTLEEACRMALDHMAQLVCRELKIEYKDAAMLISIAGDLHICQIANPLVGVRVSLSRELFSNASWL
jgi:amidase